MGKLVGDYYLGKVLGKGSFGVVRIGTNSITGEQWAVKIIDRTGSHVEDVTLMKREIAMLKKVNHPNVVKLKEVLKSKNNLYLVLELMTGDLAKQFNPRNPLSEPKARSYFQQLVVGLNHCHINDIAHRDLKPENLLLDATGVLKINDFGLSNFQPKNSVLRTHCGTYQYMAPEILQDEPEYNGQVADLWSCGVILYEMVSGKLPFDGANEHIITRNIVRGSYPKLRGISDDLRNLIDRLLTVDPSNRITIPEIAAHPWFSIGFDPNLLQVPIVEPPTQEALQRAIQDLEAHPENVPAPAYSWTAEPGATFCGLPVAWYTDCYTSSKSPA